MTLEGGRETHHAACLKHGPWPDGWKWSHCWIWYFLGSDSYVNSIYIVLVDEVAVDGGRGLLLCKHSSCASLFLSLHVQDDLEDAGSYMSKA